MEQKLSIKQWWLQKFYQNFVTKILSLKILTIVRFEVLDGINSNILFSTYNQYTDFEVEIEYHLEYFSQVILRETKEEITLGSLITKFKNLKRI